MSTWCHKEKLDEGQHYNSFTGLTPSKALTVLVEITNSTYHWLSKSEHVWLFAQTPQPSQKKVLPALSVQ